MLNRKILNSLLKNKNGDDFVYIYDNHHGGNFYVRNEELSYEDLYCETCGDGDSLIASGLVRDLLSLSNKQIQRRFFHY